MCPCRPGSGAPDQAVLEVGERRKSNSAEVKDLIGDDSESKSSEDRTLSRSHTVPMTTCTSKEPLKIAETNKI